MLYALFLVIALLYNWRKFRKERVAFLHSIKEAKSSAQREMILSHHFHVFIFEGFLAVIVAHLISEGAFAIGLLGLGFVYLLLLVLGLGLYQYFLKFIEHATDLTLRGSFNQNLIKEFRVSFALIMLPILIYSIINWTFQDAVFQDWGNLWLIGLLTNIMFVSVLTIVCTVIIMLRLIPNREITESEYLELINRRLIQIGMANMRVRWIETDIKNAFVVGLKLLRFSNQTMFLGKSLRTTLTLEEFDAVIAHELAHVANRHIHKRVIELIKNFISIIFGVGTLMAVIIGCSILYLGEDVSLHSGSTALSIAVCSLIWALFNYALFFDTIRSHEYEADAFAVIEMGASFPALKSALEKLTTPEEMPDYLKAKTQKQGPRNVVTHWLIQVFSTHPSISDRFSLLEYKLQSGLPFNHYVSSAQKTRMLLSRFFHWKVSAPFAAFFLGLLTWGTLSFQDGKRTITFIAKSSNHEIMQSQEVLSKINSRPKLIGQSLMYYIVQKRDPELIDFFLNHGALKGRTLVYLSELKDFHLFEKYYSLYQKELSEDEYFLVLRKTAQLNFTEGYRYLVNSSRFEHLDPSYQEDISRLHELRTRKPASINPK